MKPDILVLNGPTAAGKTAMAVALAKTLNGEVVSADSMQVYRGLNIGTAKPTAEEMREVPHHMLDVARPEENYSVARYVREAVPVVDDILARGKLPIVAGGTGLYIDALVAGHDFAPFPEHTGIREELRAQSRAGELPRLYGELCRVDPASAVRLHPNDEKRILRALEVWLATGRTLTEFNAETKNLPHRYHPVTVTLSYQDRARLRERIDQRVDHMVQDGLEREIRGLLDRGIPLDCTAMQAIGYKEITAAILGGLPVEAGVEEVKLRSHQYAKRQLSWFRRNKNAHWLFWEDTPNFSDAVNFVTDFALASGLQ